MQGVAAAVTLVRALSLLCCARLGCTTVLQAGSDDAAVHVGFLAVGDLLSTDSAQSGGIFLSIESLPQVNSAVAVVRRVAALTSAPLVAHIMTDVAVPIPLPQPPGTRPGQVSYVVHDLRELPPERARHVGELKGEFLKNGFFMYKPFAHELLPASLDRIILLDTDVVVLGDIASLWSEFDRFSGDQMFGMAVEQTDAYSGCEIPPHDGLKTYHGFNGGVQLLSLAAMRRSAAYRDIIGPGRFPTWFRAKKALCPEKPEWTFGDQDFYALLAESHREWYYTLHCKWNVMTCGDYQFNDLPPYPNWPKACVNDPQLLHMCGGTMHLIMTSTHEFLPCDAIWKSFSNRTMPFRIMMEPLCRKATPVSDVLGQKKDASQGGRLLLRRPQKPRGVAGSALLQGELSRHKGACGSLQDDVWESSSSTEEDPDVSAGFGTRPATHSGEGPVEESGAGVCFSSGTPDWLADER